MPEVNVSDVNEPVTIVLADADLPDSQTLEQMPEPKPVPKPEPVIKPEPVVKAEPSDDPVAAAENLRRQLADANADRDRTSLALQEESRRRQDAERNAAQNAGRANEAVTAAGQANYDMVISALTAAEAQASQLTADHAKAMTDGDFAAASKIQMEMAKVGGRIDRLETGKIEMDAQRASPTVRTPAPQQQPATTDWNRPWNNAEAETYLRGRTPQTAAWIRQNDKFIHDVKFRNQVAAAHNLAEAKGISVDSDEYFKFVNMSVGVTEQTPEPTPEPEPRPAPKAPVTAAAKTVSRQSPTAAAPPSRTTQGGPPGSPGGASVTLTAEERKLARQMFTKDVIGNEDPEVVYARHKRNLIAEGRIPG